MILLVVPSRGRPAQAQEFLEAWRDATTGLSKVVFCVDTNDRTLHEYPRLQPGVLRWTGPRRTMVGWTNYVTKAPADDVTVLASLGDDHRLTLGFEQWVEDALKPGPGIVYGDDGLTDLPTAVFISREITEALGYMVPPTISHYYADNFWKTLGQEAGCLRYVPEMKTPHLHHSLDPARHDQVYAESWARRHEDAEAYRDWYENQRPEDVAKVKAVL